MVRVSSFGQQQLLIQALQENQQRVFDGQRQITTGRVTDEFQGLAGDTGVVLGSKSFLSRTETYQQTIDTIRGRLSANEVQIGGIIGSVESFQDTVLTAIANNNAQGFEETLDQTFAFLLNSLNTNIDGTFLFSGARTGTSPVNVNDLDELNAAITAGSVADVFDNAAVAFEARIADAVNLEFGLLASDIGSEIFTVLNNINEYIQGTSPLPGAGPLQGELNTDQFAFLQDQVAALNTALENLRQIQVTNGLVFERLDVVDNQHADTVVFLQSFISEIEDVDIAEAVTQLNNDQLALEASFQAIGSLRQLTLLNFI